MNDQSKANPLALLEPWLNDPDVLEIMVDGYDTFYVERKGNLVDEPTPFRDNEHLMEIINAIAAPLGRRVDKSSPIMDTRLPDGSRCNAVIPPIAVNGPALVVRKFLSKPVTLEDVLRYGAVSEDMVEFLRAAVIGRCNIVVAGGVGSGKTQVTNILAGMIPTDERIITVENVIELRWLETHKRVVRLESRPPNIEGKGEVTVQDLVINALRMRPDRLIVGEMRAAEALDWLQAISTGHDGSLTSMHASSPRDALTRLEMMATFHDVSMPLLTVRQMIASAVNLITYQERLSDGTRKILKISEVTGMQGSEIGLQDIFEFRETGVDEDDKIAGHYTATGIVPNSFAKIKRSRQVKALGVELSEDIFTPS